MIMHENVQGNEGNKLHHEYGALTDALEPPHQFVPWIIVNGVYSEENLDEAEYNLLEFVCKTYEGELPEACNQ